MTQFARLAVVALGTGAGSGLIMGAVLAGFILLLINTDSFRTQRAICDREVATLLSTDSLVELERAKYLIERLDCSIKRRLPG